MDSDLVVLSGGNAASAATYGEHHVTLVLEGDPAALRERLASAAERLGYRVLADDPLVVRRSGTSRYGSVIGTTLDYDRTLTFRLKPKGAGTTVVTFNYVGYPLNYKGPKLVIQREAEAIAALASERRRTTTCFSCGTPTADDSRYCRSCGMLAVSEPAELQVMELTNSIQSAGGSLITAGIGMSLATLTFGLVMALKGFASFTPAIAFTLMWMIPSFVFLGIGIRQLSRGLRPKQLAPAPPTGSNPGLYSTDIFAPPTGQLREMDGRTPSVTEGTTNLLPPPATNSSLDG